MEKFDEERAWAEMPQEILETFVQKLKKFEDKVRFGSVCKGWYPIAPIKPYLWTPETPWLINNVCTSHFDLYRISDMKVFKIDKPFKSLEGSEIVGSLKGWLFIRTVRERLIILNPFSKCALNLPSQRRNLPLNFLFPFGYIAFGMVHPLAFSISTGSCPNVNPTTIAMVTCGGGLVWCKPGDKEWKYHECEEEFGNILLHKDKFYAVDRKGGKVYIFRFEKEDKLVHVATTDAFDDVQLQHYDVDTGDIPEPHVDAYMVECGGRVLVVRRYYLRRCTRPTSYFVVLEVDEKSDKPQLEEVYSIGDHILFVGDSSCESLPAKHCLGLARDVIYFTGYYTHSGLPYLGEFSLVELDFVKNPLHTPNLHNFLWLMPRFAFPCEHTCCKHAPWSLRRMNKKRKFSATAVKPRHDYLLRSKTRALPLPHRTHPL